MKKNILKKVFGKDIKEVIRDDCEFFENQINSDLLYGFYLHLNDCERCESNGLYQLMLNDRELWYGTLNEINAIVKTLCKLSDNYAFKLYLKKEIK